MFIKVNGEDYELSTKLKTVAAIEDKFNITMQDLDERLETATVGDLITILVIAEGNKVQGLREALLGEWDYTDLLFAVRELITRCMYGGTPEQNEAKIAKSGASDERKNATREILGLPVISVPDSTGSE